MEKRKGESSGPGEKKENLQVPCEEKTSDVHNSCWTFLQPDVPSDHRLLESRSLTTYKDVWETERLAKVEISIIKVATIKARGFWFPDSRWLNLKKGQTEASW